MNIKLIVMIIIITSLLNLGCHCNSYMRLMYTDQPVMLGKVQKIGGTTMQPSVKVNDFDISHYSGAWDIAVLNADKWYHFHDNVGADGELKKRVAAPDNLIKVDSIYFKSSFMLFTIILFGFVKYESATGIQGHVYEGKSFNQAEDSVKAINNSGEKL